jgi:hypothetical protein
MGLKVTRPAGTVPNKAPAAKAAKAPKEPKPARPKISATDEEIMALCAGKLNPRDYKGTAQQDALTQVSEDGKAVGRPLGVSTGLPIQLAFGYMFQENQKVASACRIKGLGHATDEKCSAWIKREFPGRGAGTFDNIAYCRRYFNNGQGTKGNKPKWTSDRFDDNGAAMAPGTRGFSKKEAVPAKAAVATKPVLAKPKVVARKAAA